MENSEPRGSSKSNNGRVAFARAVLMQGSLEFDSEGEAAAASLVSGTEERRYRKNWRLGKLNAVGGFIYGRLGFEREDPTTTDVWDDELMDFVEAAFTSGAVSPFALRQADLTIAFQLRGNDIDVGSFTYALGAIMRHASSLNWKIVPLKREVTFDQWAASVEVTTLAATVKRPNPNYADRPDVEGFIEGPGAEVAQAEWRARAGSCLNVEDALIQQFVDHAARRHYGKVKAKGVRDGAEVSYSGDGEELMATVSVDPETGDVGSETLSRLIESESRNGEGRTS